MIEKINRALNLFQEGSFEAAETQLVQCALMLMDIFGNYAHPQGFLVKALSCQVSCSRFQRLSFLLLVLFF